MSGFSSDAWKAQEEDLNQRFLALRSHCATDLMAQSHVGLTQGSAWSVEETINPILVLLLLKSPYCNTFPINSGSPEQYRTRIM